MPLFKRGDDDDDDAGQEVAVAGNAAPEEAPHAGQYEAGSLAGIPESGRERIERMKQDVARGVFTSDLSGQDFSALLGNGYRPVGLVMGNCVYHVAHQGLRAAWRQIGRNQEMPTYTQALYQARELAMGRMQTEAEQLQSNGIVGARI